MLEYRARPARLRWNSLHLPPTLTGSLGFVDTATCRSDDVIGIAWIDVDSEDVRIVNDSVAYRTPRLATVRGLVRKMESTGLNNIR